MFLRLSAGTRKAAHRPYPGLRRYNWRQKGLKSWVFRLISQCQLEVLAVPSPVSGPPAPGFSMAIPAELGLHAGLPFDELAYGDELRGP